MKASKATVLTFAEKCKNILASNWQGHLNTIKADAKGSKEDIYTSKVKYIFKKGKPYIWVPEKDLHNLNTMIDERGSFAVTSPFPGSLASLLRSVKKLPARVALTGDVVPLKDEKVEVATESLREAILSEHKAISESSYSVSGILSSSNLGFMSRSENLLELLDGDEQYMVYKFNLRSCMFIDGKGGSHEVDLEGTQASKADMLSPFSATLIDGINQSEARRRALMLFCLIYLNVNARRILLRTKTKDSIVKPYNHLGKSLSTNKILLNFRNLLRSDVSQHLYLIDQNIKASSFNAEDEDAYMISIDRKGFDVLGKVPSRSLVAKDGFREYEWKEFRFTFKEEARDIEAFCRQLVEMEEEVLKNVSSYSGLG